MYACVHRYSDMFTTTTTGSLHYIHICIATAAYDDGGCCDDNNANGQFMRQTIQRQSYDNSGDDDNSNDGQFEQSVDVRACMCKIIAMVRNESKWKAIFAGLPLRTLSHLPLRIA